MTLDEWAAKDREFAISFVGLMVDPDSHRGKAGIEILARTLAEAREQGRREQLRRDIG